MAQPKNMQEFGIRPADGSKIREVTVWSDWTMQKRTIQFWEAEDGTLVQVTNGFYRRFDEVLNGVRVVSFGILDASAMLGEAGFGEKIA